ncbi:MAG: putative sulfate exporter family transporter [Acidobacteria bacterium]|nr:putative sulfate exporter family transporter [Acidobacteriota bacterium]HEV8158273.1 putative sulfate exporter family transporter [Pyrinomonadaceae bacterium]
MVWQKILFFLLLFACLTAWVSPPIALVLGLFAALTFGNPFPEQTKKATKILLQTSVVLLGFGMNLTSVIKAGKDGIVFTIVTIFGTLIVGYLTGKLLKVEEKTSALISSGTAICGGSAIAAVAPAIDADGEQISVSLGTVFILNSVALILFPIIGRALNLSQNQFGIWSAIAIHDTSSVVGAAQSYGADALAIATTIKLARALWIAPVALLFSFIYRSKKAKIAIPYFIFFFLLATLIRTYMPGEFPPSVFDSLVNLAKAGLTVTLFLIGASLSRETLKKVGIKPLFQGVLLWILISIVSLWAVSNLL